MNSEASPKNSKVEAEQLPLKGFRTEWKSPKTAWRKFVEGMGDGRYRIHLIKNRK